ncbi:MAG TPA: nodulation protein NfeD [Dongiaceae bacterium]|jgi:membrane-bound serine protease (ClpP class)
MMRARVQSQGIRGAMTRLGAAAFVAGLCLLGAPAETQEPSAVLLEVRGAIGPASADYVLRGIARAEEGGAALVVLRLDTPGGLDSSMREIIQAILAAKLPVVTYVTPSGARAASAGTYILYASHIAAMAPATTLGAATPVQIGGTPDPFSPPAQPPEKAPEKDEGDSAGGEKPEAGQGTPVPIADAMSAKMINDAAAYIRGLAAMRGRNADWAERAVREAASLSADEALAQHVVDIVATDVADLLRQADGRKVMTAAGEITLRSKDLPIESLDADWRTQVLAILTDPNVAVILMMIGIYGLIFEFMNPGAVLPGVIGAIALLLALYALNVLPVNFAGLGLILVGIVLMAAEGFVASHGILAIGGAVAFLIGATILFDPDVPGLALSWPVIVFVLGVGSLLFVTVLLLALRSRRRPVVSGREEMIGSAGRVVTWADGRGRVSVHGEQWLAESATPLAPGEAVRVVALRDLTVTVEPDR